jgi:N-acyl-D-aspartate/D-glutamate deacylase
VEITSGGEMKTPLRRALFCGLVACILTAGPSLQQSDGAQEYDLVILNGRVVDPESRLDAVRNVGIAGGRIRAISASALRGRTTIEAGGLVVAPGFIDLHSHGQDEENYRFKAMDGVTTALELEVGAGDIDRWYAERKGRALINYGVSIGHIPTRMAVMRDPGNFLPSGDAAHRAASVAEVAEIRERIERGLKRGALAIGFGINYTASASRWEVLELFRVAGRLGAPCHVHMRYAGMKEPASSIAALEEVIAAAALTGASLHVVHITSTGLRGTPQLLQMITEARSRGLDVTTECYPYTATQTRIETAIYDPGWQEVLGVDYKDLQWVETGERLTAESFEHYRRTGGMVIGHSIPEEIARTAVANPIVMIASDGHIEKGKGHPRGAGTFARVLGRYVREQKALTLMDALAKMTLLPARRLDRVDPEMKNKGRIRVGADADLTLLDPGRVADMATFEGPPKYSEGIKYVLVNGIAVVKDGQLQSGVNPGRPVRAPLR